MDLDTPTQIYLISNGRGAYKIGISADPRTRLAQLQGANPSRLVLLHTFPGTHETEQRLHKHFAGKRLEGEWFALDAADIQRLCRTGSVEAARSEPLAGAAGVLERDILTERVSSYERFIIRLAARSGITSRRPGMQFHHCVLVNQPCPVFRALDALIESISDVLGQVCVASISGAAGAAGAVMLECFGVGVAVKDGQVDRHGPLCHLIVDGGPIS